MLHSDQRHYCDMKRDESSSRPTNIVSTARFLTNVRNIRVGLDSEGFRRWRVTVGVPGGFPGLVHRTDDAQTPRIQYPPPKRKLFCDKCELHSQNSFVVFLRFTRNEFTWSVHCQHVTDSPCCHAGQYFQTICKRNQKLWKRKNPFFPVRYFNMEWNPLRR